MDNGYKFYELDGAFYRMNPGKGDSWLIDDILANGKWEKYTGDDRLKPFVFGDRVDDPLGGGGQKNGQSPFGGAHDEEQHWITAHPHGKGSKGTPLLIGGEPGAYKVKGGAGGKLDGKVVAPHHMSKLLDLAGGESKEQKPKRSYNKKDGEAAGAEQPALGLAETPQPQSHHVETELRKILGNKVSSDVIDRVLALIKESAEAGSASRKSVPKGSIKITTSAGTSIEAKPEVVDLSDLIASNDDDGKVNPKFPQYLQPRDRTTAASQAQINSLAGQLRPELLAPSPEASAGAPIVGPDGVVESGNGRVMALRRALTNPSYTEQGKLYRDWMKEQGYDTDGIENPVLVMRRTSKLDEGALKKFTLEANERTTLGMGAAERARADATRAGESIDLWKGSDAAAASNSDFVRSFMSGMSAEERGSMQDPDGSLSGEGMRRIQSAVTAHAYREQFGSILDRFLAGDTEGMRAIAGAMSDAAGAWAKMRKGVASGEVPPAMDITKDLASAISLIARARQLQRPVAEMVSQTDFDRPPLNETAEKLLHEMFRDPGMKRPAGRDIIAAKLGNYATMASKTSAGKDMFGADPPAPSEVLKLALKKDIAEDSLWYEDHGMAHDADADADRAWYDAHGMGVGRPFATDAWQESEHPRGEPENAGEFAPKGGGSTSAKAEAPQAAASRVRVVKTAPQEPGSIPPPKTLRDATAGRGPPDEPMNDADGRILKGQRSESAWHMASFAKAEPRMLSVIANTLPLTSVVADRNAHANYDPETHAIEMWPSGTNESNAMMWRHEFGHAIDFSNSENDSSLSYRRANGLREEDAAALLEKQPEKTIADFSGGWWGQEKREGEGEWNTEAINRVLSGADLSHDTILDCIKRRVDPDGLIRVVRQDAGTMDDFLGAMTRNKIGAGHSLEYYDRMEDSQSAEMFANYVALSQGESGEVYRKVLHAVAPKACAEFDRILDDVASGKMRRWKFKETGDG